MNVVVNWSYNDVLIESACKYVARYGKFSDVCIDQSNAFGKFDVGGLSANRMYYHVNLALFAQDCQQKYIGKRQRFKSLTSPWNAADNSL